MNERERQALLLVPFGMQGRTGDLRQDKIEHLKRLIAQGRYQVPGKAVVSKWFPTPRDWNPENRALFT